MNNYSLFENKIIDRFNFSGYYIGYVLDNSEFENTLQIKVFIPELFGYMYNPAINNIDSSVDISTSHLLNDDVKLTTKIDKQEYVYARVLLDRSTTTTTKEEFIKEVVPDVGEKVLVSFLNDNPNNCIYENVLFLTEGESIALIESNKVDGVTTIKVESENNTRNTSKVNVSTKIKWSYN